MRGTAKPRRPAGEPEVWKLWLWCAIALAAIVLAASAPYWHSHRNSPGLAP